jgi:hypothetical protein
MREAYLSVVLSESEPASVEAAPKEAGRPGDGRFWGVGVDAGTVAFVDADAIPRCMPAIGSDWYSEVFDTGGADGWFAQMDADSPYPAGTANIVLPRATDGENLVLSHSGWGDGFYPLLQSVTADGTITAVHIELLVVGEPEAEEPEPKRGFAEAPTPESSKGWLRRLFGGR